MSWLERPYTATPRQQAYLDGLRVTVSIPVYNEEPVVLDRVLYALFAQTRLPNRVDVVDDGSTQEDYSAVRDYWLAHHPPSVELTWHRYPNAGKKRFRPARSVPIPRRTCSSPSTPHHARAQCPGGGPQAIRRSPRPLRGGNRASVELQPQPAHPD